MSQTPRLIVPSDACLLVIDIQEKLLPSIHEAERLEAMSIRMIRAAQTLEVPVIVTEQYPNGLGPTVPAVLEAADAAQVWSKTTFGCMGTPEIVDAVRATGCSTIIMVGIEAHVCVTQTALGALDLGFTVHVVSDAVSSRDARNVEIGLARMRQAGAVVTSSEMTIFELVGNAKSPVFRAILSLVK